MKKVLTSAILFTFMAMNAQNSNLNDFEYLEYDIAKIQNLYSTKQASVKEVIKAYLKRIDEIDQNGIKLNSVITVNPDAMKIADSLDQIPLKKRKGALFGIPVLLKDNIDTHDKMPTTAGSLALKNSFPKQDSEIAKKLREAGAVIIGKNNLSEWANFREKNSTSGWSGYGGVTKNPYDLTRNTCGSSAGSGASISANLGVISIGTETNGSIVCPSSLNGIVGLKPTVGLLSRSGIIPISSSQDTPGPMARTVRDVAVSLGALTSIDKRDAITSENKNFAKTNYLPYLTLNGLKGKRFGYSKNPTNGSHPKVDELFNKTLEFLKSEGAELIEIDNVISRETDGASFELMVMEYKDGLNDYFKSLGEDAPIKSLEELIEFNKNSPEELQYFGQEYLIMAQETDGIKDKKYAEARNKAYSGSRENGIDAVMKKHQLDAIIAPTASPAWKTDLINGDNYLFGTSSPAAISGYPNISLPMGNIKGLPVGISIYAEKWSEGKLLEIAYTFEQKNPQRIIPQFKNQ